MQKLEKIICRTTHVFIEPGIVNVNIALRRFFYNSWQYRDKRKPEVVTVSYFFNDLIFLLHSTVCTLQTFE